MRMRTFLYFSCGLTFFTWLEAVDLVANEADRQPVIRIESNLVLVPVSVTDTEGRPVTDLQARDFVVLEDGAVQEVVRVEAAGDSPLELALVFDTSGSVSARFDFEKKTGMRFLQKMLGNGTAVSIFTVGQKAQMVLGRTVNRSAAVEALEDTKATRSATALYDAIGAAASYLQSNSAAGVRKAILVISDGEDNFSSQFNPTRLGRQLQEADIVFYSINPSSGASLEINVISRKGQAALEQLANPTGGAAFAPRKLEQVPSIFDRIAAELSNQYLLGYYAANREQSGFRRLEVRLPGRPNLRVRARQGYYAPAAR